MRQQDSNIIAFPVRAPQTAECPTAPEATPRVAGSEADGDAIQSAARAGAAAADAIVDILGAHAHGADGDAALAASKAANAGVLWGAVLGVARRHGQIPALTALEHIAEQLREDPQRLMTGSRHRPAETETARAVWTLLA